MNTASPCIRVCRLDRNGLCAACGRSLEEIARWGRMEDAEKARVLAALEQRREKAVALPGEEVP